MFGASYSSIISFWGLAGIVNIQITFVWLYSYFNNSCVAAGRPLYWGWPTDLCMNTCLVSLQPEYEKYYLSLTAHTFKCKLCIVLKSLFKKKWKVCCDCGLIFLQQKLTIDSLSVVLLWRNTHKWLWPTVGLRSGFWSHYITLAHERFSKAEPQTGKQPVVYWYSSKINPKPTFLWFLVTLETIVSCVCFCVYGWANHKTNRPISFHKLITELLQRFPFSFNHHFFKYLHFFAFLLSGMEARFPTK